MHATTPRRTPRWLRRTPPLLPILLAACAGTGAADAPWPIVYREDFATADRIAPFAFGLAERWRWRDAHGRPALELVDDPGERRDYAPPFRSPMRIALLPDVEVADFDLDVDVLQTGRDYGHRDLCLVFGFESPQRFYYVHLAPAPDAHAHNVFRVADAPRSALAPVPTSGVDWGRGVWHHVRIERRVVGDPAGSIRVFWDGAPEPILVAADTTFAWGRLGLGSFDDSGCFANVIVRAPAARPVAGPTNPFTR